MIKLANIFKHLFGGWIKEPSRLTQIIELINRNLKRKDNDGLSVVLLISDSNNDEYTGVIHGKGSDLEQLISASITDDKDLKVMLTHCVFSHYIRDMEAGSKATDLLNDMGFDLETDNDHEE